MIYNQIKNECAENTSLAPCYATMFLLHDLLCIEAGDKQIGIFYKLSVKQHMELECETFLFEQWNWVMNLLQFEIIL